jgi:chaperonin cofactor prefoldin
MTLAHEKEKEMLPTLKNKNEQLYKAIQVIEHHRGSLEEKVKELERKKADLEARVPPTEN